MSTSLSDFLNKQRQEALGPDNKWFCSQHHGYEVTDPELLLCYYIKHGGAMQFRRQHPLDPRPASPTPACQSVLHN